MQTKILKIAAILMIIAGIGMAITVLVFGQDISNLTSASLFFILGVVFFNFDKFKKIKSKK